jgi:hypothetical protein
LFEREHHQRIEQLLRAIKHERMLALQCVFGGGTAIALAFGEHRESRDIDFLCSSPESFRTLRNLVDSEGVQSLFAAPVRLLREARLDAYGVRCALLVDGVAIKFEVIQESNVRLSDPLQEDRICGVWRARREDLVATKLTANADRWSDGSTASRDLIDLVALAQDTVLSPEGVHKAREAYGPVIDSSFRKAKAFLIDNPAKLGERMKLMQMGIAPKRMLEQIKALKLGTLSQSARPQSSAAGRPPRCG